MSGWWGFAIGFACGIIAFVVGVAAVILWHEKRVDRDEIWED